MSEQPKKIEGRCGCGEQYWDGTRWRILGGTHYAFEYCPHCGCHLGDDGFARPTIIDPEVTGQDMAEIIRELTKARTRRATITIHKEVDRE